MREGLSCVLFIKRVVFFLIVCLFSYLVIKESLPEKRKKVHLSIFLSGIYSVSSSSTKENHGTLCVCVCFLASSGFGNNNL